MPTYEYRCDDNGHEFEMIQGFNDPPGAECPACGSISHRRISMPAIHFKGSGWYRKDNASSGSRKSGSSSDESKSDSKSGSDSKSSSDKSSSSSDSSNSSGGSSGAKTHTHGGSTHSH